MIDRLAEEGNMRYFYSDVPRGELVEMYHKEKEKSDKRLKLMQEQDKKIKVCQFCYHRKHTKDCRWAKELGDD